jgi:hypothetical protein
VLAEIGREVGEENRVPPSGMASQLSSGGITRKFIYGLLWIEVVVGKGAAEAVDGGL